MPTRSKMQKAHFLLRCFFRDDYSTSCGRSGSAGDPTGACAEENEMCMCLGQPRQALLENAKNAFSSCDVYASEAYSCGGPEGEVAF